jgi:hypothetical protein
MLTAGQKVQIHLKLAVETRRDRQSQNVTTEEKT